MTSPSSRSDIGVDAFEPRCTALSVRTRTAIVRMVSLGLILLMITGAAYAASINRCIDADGILVYTDSSCRSLGIAERSDEPIVIGVRAVRKLQLRLGCAARSPEALRSAVADAIDQRDFNALSGLYNFDGRSRRTAAPVVSRLERMAKRPVAVIELVTMQSESLFGELIPDLSVMPELRVTQYTKGEDGPLSIETFGLTRSAGCVWLAR
jgi:hypothetical protein